MANFTTVDDLANDALWLAGEVQSSSSQYYTRCYDLMNAVLTALLAGGAFGDRTLPQVDWWWARKAQRGSIILLNAFNNAKSISATLTQDSATVTFASMTTGLSLVDYLILVDSTRDQMPRISAHTASATTATLDTAWKPASTTITKYVAAKFDYATPTDFVRFSGPITHGRYPYVITVADAQVIERDWPRARAAAGAPYCAAVVDPDLIRFSHYLTDGPLVVEFEYIYEPTALAAGGAGSTIPIPHVHRRVLSLGAAFLMLVEKRDKSADRMYAQFSAAWDAMQTEQAKTTDNPNYGRILSRPNETAASVYPLRTSSGLIIG